MNMLHLRTLSVSLALVAMLGLSASALAAAPQKGGTVAPDSSGAGTGMAGRLSPEKRELVKKLHEEFYTSTKVERQELLSKRHELDAQLYSATPDEKKIQALTKEISDLRAKLYSARIALKGKLIQAGILMEHGGYGPGMGRGAGSCDGKGKGGGMHPGTRDREDACRCPK